MNHLRPRRNASDQRSGHNVSHDVKPPRPLPSPRPTPPQPPLSPIPKPKPGGPIHRTNDATSPNRQSVA